MISGNLGKPMQAKNRSGLLALGISLAFHSLPFAIFCSISPAAASHASVSTFTLDTRSGPPRTMHLTLWDEPKGNPKPPTVPEKPVSAIEAPAPSRPLEAVNTPTQNVFRDPSLAPAASESTEPPAPTQAMDYAALTRSASTGRGPGLGGSTPGGFEGGRRANRGRGGFGLLGLSREVQSVVFVVDGSSSMGMDGSFEKAKRELIASIEALSPATRFQVIVYNRSAQPLNINGHMTLVLATPDNKQAAFALIGRLDPEGSTDHVKALRQALLLQPEEIVFVTDGDGLRPDQVCALTSLNRGRSTIHAFELSAGSRHEKSSLQILAEQNHGDFRREPVVER